MYRLLTHNVLVKLALTDSLTQYRYVGSRLALFPEESHKRPRRSLTLAGQAQEEIIELRTDELFYKIILQLQLPNTLEIPDNLRYRKYSTMKSCTTRNL